MPSAVTASNSYITVAEADSILDDRLYTTGWGSAEADDRARAVLWSTRILDEQFEWCGQPVAEDQPLAWPRRWITDRQGAPVEGIPGEVKTAAALLALALVTSNRVDEAQSGGQAIREISVDDIVAKYEQGVVPESYAVPDNVLMAIPGWWYSAVRERGDPIFGEYAS